VKILLLSTGGGGGNILRSIKTLFRQDVAMVQKTDARYADRLRRAVATRFLDTNEFSLADVPAEERVLIGAATTRRLGSGHNPAVAREALEESRTHIETLFHDYPVIVLIGTGGKGTGAGTIFPLAQMARRQRKLILPVFIRPSFEWHEVDKRRYDHALQVIDEFDSAQIRCIEILNDRGYSVDDPQPQASVWQRMNIPIARALRGLLYVLSDLSQVDPSDLSTLCAGAGRLRIGYGELEPSPGQEPTDELIDEAVRRCWQIGYYGFTKPVGTSLVCIQGDWSNVVDAKIKGRLATWASSDGVDSAYTPLYARPISVPRPWGITALFAEHTGTHTPLEIDWPLESRVSLLSRGPLRPDDSTHRPAGVEATQAVPEASSVPAPPAEETPEPPAQPFPTFWDLCLAVNRRDSRALMIAGNGATSDIPVDVTETRKLLGTVWFRAVFAQLSQPWRDRLLTVIASNVRIANDVVRSGRRTARLSELTYEELTRVPLETILPDALRSDVHLLIAVGSLWGMDATRRFEFVDAVSPASSRRPLFSFAGR